ncbi:hypothetical protein [Lysinibacillus sp. BW-2-10]|uniref:hypothetical protein n=1 Tax=Lysinibacillus sp. BW-2-10 TaxID=2590030 RepID=UPI00117F1E8B|nr:hypothetical protein [Lysinibacillus sp. BW-2-10]TSI07395.1 hypothetical protein FJQ64_08825 [Lysinibacillus sp. BW-2-10]
MEISKISSKKLIESSFEDSTNEFNLEMSISNVENQIKDFIKQKIDSIGSEELILFKEILELLTEMKIKVK